MRIYFALGGKVEDFEYVFDDLNLNSNLHISLLEYFSAIEGYKSIIVQCIKEKFNRSLNRDTKIELVAILISAGSILGLTYLKEIMEKEKVSLHMLVNFNGIEKINLNEVLKELSEIFLLIISKEDLGANQNDPYTNYDIIFEQIWKLGVQKEENFLPTKNILEEICKNNPKSKYYEKMKSRIVELEKEYYIRKKDFNSFKEVLKFYNTIQ